MGKGAMARTAVSVLITCGILILCSRSATDDIFDAAVHAYNNQLGDPIIGVKYSQGVSPYVFTMDYSGKYSKFSYTKNQGYVSDYSYCASAKSFLLFEQFLVLVCSDSDKRNPILTDAVTLNANSRIGTQISMTSDWAASDTLSDIVEYSELNQGKKIFFLVSHGQSATALCIDIQQIHNVKLTSYGSTKTPRAMSTKKIIKLVYFTNLGMFAAAYEDGAIMIFSYASNYLFPAMSSHASGFIDMLYVNDNSVLVTGGAEGKLKIFSNVGAYIN